MNALSRLDTDRLARLCGMLGSDHAGERSNAASLATRELQRAGLTWDTLVRRACALAPAAPASTRAPRPAEDVAMLSAVRRHLSRLTPWEATFAENLLAWRGRFTPKQRATLRQVYERVVAGGDR